MVELQIFRLVAHVLLIIVGYTVSGLAFYVYSRSNSSSMAFLGTGLVFQNTPFLLAFIARRGVEIPHILFIDYILQFSGFVFIGYGIVLHWND